jgi:hypothetical protein
VPESTGWLANWNRLPTATRKPCCAESPYHAPGPGKVRVWLKVYSPRRRSPPASSILTRRAIIVSEEAAFAHVMDC